MGTATVASGLRLAVVTHEFPTVANPDEGCSFYDLARELEKRCAVRFFCLSPSYPGIRALRPRTFRPQAAAAALPGVNVTFIRFPALPLLTRPFSTLLASRRAHQQIASWRPNAILAYFIYPQGCAAVSIGRRLNLPVILGARGSDLLRISSRLARRQITNALRSASAVTGVSRDLVRRAILLGANPEQSVCIPNGCRPSVFYPRDKRVARQSLGLQDGEKYVLFVGRFVHLKGVQDLLHALALLNRRRKPVKLLCVGQGPMESKLSKLAERLSIAGHVTFTGPKRNEEIGQYLGAADVLCLPSYSEGSPSVILEALSSGRPVVASSVGGIPDLLDERCGILVPPRSPAHLGAALEDALARNWDANEISRRFGRDWSHVAADTLNFCLRCLPNIVQPCN